MFSEPSDVMLDASLAHCELSRMLAFLGDRLAQYYTRCDVIDADSQISVV